MHGNRQDRDAKQLVCECWHVAEAQIEGVQQKNRLLDLPTRSPRLDCHCSPSLQGQGRAPADGRTAGNRLLARRRLCQCEAASPATSTSRLSRTTSCARGSAISVDTAMSSMAFSATVPFEACSK